MPHLTLNFQIHLQSLGSFDPLMPNGPLFNRWLPNGRQDALQLTEEGAETQISVWFVRRADNRAGLLKWKHDGNAFDEQIMRRQAKLEAGLLYGEIVTRVSDAELESVQRNPIAVGEQFGAHDPNDLTYRALGKRVVDYIHERVARFISVLRSQYGQYWLEELRPWDSRQMSLGSYCSGMLGLTWQADTAGPRYWFLPTSSALSVTVGGMRGRGYEEYLTEEDWRSLQRKRYPEEISLALELFGKTAQSLGWGESRQAFVNVISTLEIALTRRMQVPSEHARTTTALASLHDQQTLPARAALVMLATGQAPEAVEAVLNAIDVRNKVVHEGYQPKSTEINALYGAMKAIGLLLGLTVVKIPTLDSSNILYAA